MISIRPISLMTSAETASELTKMGFSASQAVRLANETVCLHFKIEGIQDSVIPRLKEMAHALATHLIISPISHSSSKPDLLISGTPFQIHRLADAIQEESADLDEISAELRLLLKNIERTRFTIPCRTKTLRLGEATLVMGTISVTPDSFSDRGKLFDPDRAVAQALQMVEEGADIIDIGGESTRPGSRGTEPEQELRRIIPVIERVSRQTDTPISVDTRRARVARVALDAGCQIVNDISALQFDQEMACTVATYDVPLILMHMRGIPETMQQDIHYVSLFSEIAQYLKESIDLAGKVGVNPEKIIIDPGIGFGKTVEHNLAIIKHLSQFRILGRPILIGTSRKSFIGKILNLDVSEREEGTIATVAASILNGAHIVRVHNVRNAVRAARIMDALKTVSLPEA